MNLTNPTINSPADDDNHTLSLSGDSFAFVFKEKKRLPSLVEYLSEFAENCREKLWQHCLNSGGDGGANLCCRNNERREFLNILDIIYKIIYYFILK